MNVFLECAEINLFVCIEDLSLHDLIHAKFDAAGFKPREVNYEEIFTLEPSFRKHGEAVFVVNMGADRERIHTLAQHLCETWSEKGFVLYIHFYPSLPTQEEVFRMWKLDAGWKYDSPQMFWTLSRPSDEGIEQDVNELIRIIPRMTCLVVEENQ